MAILGKIMLLKPSTLSADDIGLDDKAWADTGVPVMAVNDKGTRVYIGLGSTKSRDRQGRNLLIVKLDNKNGTIIDNPRLYRDAPEDDNFWGLLPFGVSKQISCIAYSKKHNKLYLTVWRSDTTTSAVTCYNLDSNGDPIGNPKIVSIVPPGGTPYFRIYCMALHPSKDLLYLAGETYGGYVVQMLDNLGNPIGDKVAYESVGDRGKRAIAIDADRNLLYLGSLKNRDNSRDEGLLEIIRLGPDSVHPIIPIHPNDHPLLECYPGFNSNATDGEQQYFRFFLLKNAIILADIRNGLCVWELNNVGIPVHGDMATNAIFDQPKYTPKEGGKIQAITVDKSTGSIWVAEDAMVRDALPLGIAISHESPSEPLFSKFNKTGFNLNWFQLNDDGSLFKNIPSPKFPSYNYRIDAMQIISDLGSMPVILGSRFSYFTTSPPDKYQTKFLVNQVSGYLLGVRAFEVTKTTLGFERSEIRDANFQINYLSPAQTSFGQKGAPISDPIEKKDNHTWFSLDAFLQGESGQQLLGITVTNSHNPATIYDSVEFDVIIKGIPHTIPTPTSPEILFHGLSERVSGNMMLLLVPGYDFILPRNTDSTIEWRSKHTEDLLAFSAAFAIKDTNDSSNERPKKFILTAYGLIGGQAAVGQTSFFYGLKKQLDMELRILRNLGFNTVQPQYWRSYGEEPIGLSSQDIRNSFIINGFSHNGGLLSNVNYQVNSVGLEGRGWNSRFEYEYEFYEQPEHRIDIYLQEHCPCKSLAVVNKMSILQQWLCKGLVCDEKTHSDVNATDFRMIQLIEESVWHYPLGKTLMETVQNATDPPTLRDDLLRQYPWYWLGYWIDFLARNTSLVELKALITAYDDKMNRAFRNFLRDRSQNPPSFFGVTGVSRWDNENLLRDLKPTFKPQIINTDPRSKRRFYWTMRFFAETANSGFGNVLRPLLSRLGFSDSTFVCASFSKYWWYDNEKYPSDKEVLSTSAGHYDILDFGRRSTMSAIVEDNGITDRGVAEYYPFWSNLLRCSSVLANGRYTSKQFGLLVHHGSMGEHKDSASYRLLSAVGHGAKAFVFYRYGDGFSSNDYWANRPKIFEQIADAIKIVGKAEDLLYPGVPRRGRVALLYPYGSKLWDDFEGEISYYEKEIRYLHTALIQSGYTVDIIDEQDIRDSVLSKSSPEYRDYTALYIMGPNLPVDVQEKIRDWVRNDGGVVAVMPGAAVADEYNEPTTIFDALLGVEHNENRERILETSQSVTDGLSDFRLSTTADIPGANIRNLNLFGPVKPIITSRQNLQTVTEAGLLSTSSPINDASGLTINTFSTADPNAKRGLAIAYAFFPGRQFDQSQFCEGPIYNNSFEFPRFAEEQRILAVLPAMLAQTPKPIELHDSNGNYVFGVEAPLLESDSGMAVVLLNWTNEDISRLNVRIVGAGPFASVTSVQQGNIAQNFNNGDTLLSIPLSRVDVLMLKNE